MTVQILAPPRRSVSSMVSVELGTTRRSSIGAPPRALPRGTPTPAAIRSLTAAVRSHPGGVSDFDRGSHHTQRSLIVIPHWAWRIIDAERDDEMEVGHACAQDHASRLRRL